jgi:hypothetical protein
VLGDWERGHTKVDRIRYNALSGSLISEVGSADSWASSILFGQSNQHNQVCTCTWQQELMQGHKNQSLLLWKTVPSFTVCRNQARLTAAAYL